MTRPFGSVSIQEGDVLIAGLWMVPSMGGMPKTIELFRQALEAHVVSFTDGELLDREGSAVTSAEHVRIAKDWRGTAYSWAPQKRLTRADELAAKVRLVSCHTLFRYHVHWTRKCVKRRRTPYWVVPHGCLDPYVFSYRAWLKTPWMWLVGRRHLREASAVIFATRREKEKAARFMSRENGRVVHWPATNQTPTPAARLSARVELRERLHLPANSRLLVYLGRLHSMKRPTETIERFLRSMPRQTHLVVAGPDGDLSASELARCAGDDARVRVIGPVWGLEKEALLAAADGFVSLSLRENFGHSAAEAMKAGLPLILSPGNDLSGDLGNVECGWLLADDSEATAVNAFKEFESASDPKLRSMGDAARQWAERELSFQRFADELRALAGESIRGWKGQRA